MDVDYEERAIEEGNDAAAWYESRSEGLARRFLMAWKNAEERMVEDPERPSDQGGGAQFSRFQGFPYALVYRVKNGTIDVAAVMHLNRGPEYWAERIGGKRPPSL